MLKWEGRKIERIRTSQKPKGFTFAFLLRPCWIGHVLFENLSRLLNIRICAWPVCVFFFLLARMKRTEVNHLNNPCYLKIQLKCQCRVYQWWGRLVSCVKALITGLCNSFNLILVGLVSFTGHFWLLLIHSQWTYIYWCPATLILCCDWERINWLLPDWNKVIAQI